MVRRPPEMNAFEFVVLATLRAQQLMAGCLPRLEGRHKATTMAQMEVSEGRVTRADIGLGLTVIPDVSLALPSAVLALSAAPSGVE